MKEANGLGYYVTSNFVTHTHRSPGVIRIVGCRTLLRWTGHEAGMGKQ
jgi:hypothetical protein